ncbi:serine/threonine-protein kinase [Nocardia carnea]|uniref:non-specific serine/threonine protein kinase n=1 Tax=Nocardia carnea TaxID=37328 RepID=A0ABW7TGP7_9NOCA|nr:serine/threonine-protein kinase [Nocardia carnea]
MVLRIGEDFAGYRIEDELGRGGMGVVYRAVHPRLPSKTVALKVFDVTRGGPRGLRLFGREADLACGLAHPNIVRVHDRGDIGNGLCWMEMEYVDGGTVSGVLRREPTGLDPQRAVGFIGDAAAGIDYAHRNKVVHRDIKPSNLLLSTVDGTERVLVADFGIARSLDDDATVTGGGHREYSPHYVAPERFLSSLPDHRSDIYSLGATLYQLLTGSFPYPNRSDRELIHAHRHEPVPVPSRIRPALPAAFDDVIARAMAKDPADRYQSCEELAVAARCALSGTPPPDPPAPATSGPLPSELAEFDSGTGTETVVPAEQPPARRPRLRAGIALAAVLLAIGGGWALMNRATPEQPTASETTPTRAGGVFLTARCHWTVRHPIAGGSYLELPSGTADTDEPNCILNLDDRTAAVASVQRAITLCHDIPVEVSGRYDFPTKSAIRQLQQQAAGRVDGIYGPLTRANVLQWPVFRESDGKFTGSCTRLL